MTRSVHLGCLLAVVLLAGCGGGQEINPFLTLAENLGAFDEDQGIQQPGGGGERLAAQFRRNMTVTLRNNHQTAELNVSLAAWINPGSIRSADQQDQLLAGGYVQLAREVRLGSAFALAPGTFVYNGGGPAGATPVVLAPAQPGGGNNPPTPTQRAFTFITPDVVLAFYQPPVSCDSVAFVYTRNGQPLTAVPVGGPEAPFAGSTRGGGYKTLAQVDVYQCSPLRPGLFNKLAGAGRQPNEYLEGETITIDFNEAPDAQGNFAVVTIGEE